MRIFQNVPKKIHGGSKQKIKHPTFRPSQLSVERFKKFKPFNADKYLLANPDVAFSRVDPHVHCLEYGCFERRNVFNEIWLAKCIGKISSQLKSEETLLLSTPKQISVGIVFSSRGNYFMENIAHLLAAGLTKAGAQVIMLNENDDPKIKVDHRIIVAPHEFFFDGRGDRWLTQKILQSSILLSTEQIQTLWFKDSIPFLFEAKGIIDMYAHSTLLLRESGIPVIHYVPDPPLAVTNSGSNYKSHPLFRSLFRSAQKAPETKMPWSDRVIDVCFFGTESAHREELLAKFSPTLADLNCFIYYRRFSSGPLVNEDKVLVDLAAHVTAHSKILLNLHRDDFGAFEWFRIVQLGMCTGCLVLTENVWPSGSFVAGEHYVEAEGRHIPEMIDWLLKDEDGKAEAERIRKNAAKALSFAYDKNTAAVQVLNFLRSLS